MISTLYILQPVLQHILKPAFRSSLIGLILLLLAATSLVEYLILYIIGLIHLGLVVMSIALVGAQLITWLSSEVLVEESSLETFPGAWSEEESKHKANS